MNVRRPGTGAIRQNVDRVYKHVHFDPIGEYVDTASSVTV